MLNDYKDTKSSQSNILYDGYVKFSTQSIGCCSRHGTKLAGGWINNLQQSVKDQQSSGEICILGCLLNQ